MSRGMQPFDWRQHLDTHPAAEYFPRLSHDELIALGEDIRKHGLRSSIVVLREGNLHDCNPKFSLLDGRNRLDAMAAVGIDFKIQRRRHRRCCITIFLEFSGDDADIGSSLIRDNRSTIDIVRLNEDEVQAFVISANLHRRHLTPEQKREVVAKVLKATPGLSNVTVAKQVKVDDKTVAKVRRGLEATSEIPRLEKTVGTDGKARPTCIAKAQSAVAAKDAVLQVVDRLALPELGQPFDHGEIGVSAAEKTAQLPANAEVEVVAKVLPNGARAIMGSRKHPANNLDYSPTPPWGTRVLTERVLPSIGISTATLKKSSVWEPACGEGHMAEPLREYFGQVEATDIHNYGYGDADSIDFLKCAEPIGGKIDWIITNPPFNDKAELFALKGLELATAGVAIFAQLRWLESVGRYERIFRDNPPTMLAFFCERINLCMGRWDPDGTRATAYMWVVWRKGALPRAPLWIQPGQRKALTLPDDHFRFTAHPVIRRTQPPQSDNDLTSESMKAAVIDDGLELPNFLWIGRPECDWREQSLERAR